MLKSKFDVVDRQVKFKDLVGVGGGLLSYDFLVISGENKYLIEHQGVQHERPIEYFGGIEQFETQKEHDKRKREYALSKGYHFVEIWYHENLNERIEDIV